ncbi:MAG: metalloprotease [Halorientalis sp.]
MRFSTRELLDFGVAWVALSAAFTIFFDRPAFLAFDLPLLGHLLALSLLTVGVGFLLHEMAHKVTAIRFGQIAEFRADYGMLFIAVVSAMAGFIFAAPGAVYHRGRSTVRENGLIALAGPVTNLGLAVVFLPLLLFGGFLGQVGYLGVIVNLFLAGFNMLPVGPLDGKTVLHWHKGVFVVVFVPAVALGLFAMFGLSLPI